LSLSPLFSLIIFGSSWVRFVILRINLEIFVVMQAGLFDGGKKAEEEYAKVTGDLAAAAYAAANAPLDQEGRDALIDDVRSKINGYVARYR